jgi:hypothetical protein
MKLYYISFPFTGVNWSDWISYGENPVAMGRSQHGINACFLKMFTENFVPSVRSYCFWRAAQHLAHAHPRRCTYKEGRSSSSYQVVTAGQTYD